MPAQLAGDAAGDRVSGKPHAGSWDEDTGNDEPVPYTPINSGPQVPARAAVQDASDSDSEPDGQQATPDKVGDLDPAEVAEAEQADRVSSEVVARAGEELEG